MEPIKIPISLCPHVSAGKVRGWYLLAKRLFIEDTPILRKHQFIGFNGSLLVTVVHPPQIKTMFEMVTKHPKLEDRDITWLGRASLFQMRMGFKIYVPEGHLDFIEPKRTEAIGIFRRHDTFDRQTIYYLEVPKLTANILLGHKELK